MEASGAVLQRAPLTGGERRVCGRTVRRRSSLMPVLAGQFVDNVNMRYYVSCGAKKKEEKNRAKLMKRLERDLSAFYSLGFGVEPGDGLAGEVKSKMISDAANLLLSQLKELRAEEKEMKRKRKEEKATRMKNCNDSECETVIKTSSLQRVVVPIEAKPESHSIPSVIEPLMTGEAMQQRTSVVLKPREGFGSNMIEKLLQPMDKHKIEVCMGGKCKQSGALQLLGEFEKKVGTEGAVVGCKCMGKCRDGPNVRLLSHANEEDSFKPVRNPLLCLGVGLEDVNKIVTKFLGEKKDLTPLAS